VSNNLPFYKVRLKTTIYDNGDDYAPPGVLAWEGEELQVIKYFDDNKVYVAHEQKYIIDKRTFRIFKNEYEKIND